MDLMKYVIVLIALLLRKAAGCPPEEELAPFCNCMSLGQDNFMTCKNLLSHEQLIGPMRAVANSHTKVFAITIMESSLMYVPHNIFRGTDLEKIRFLKTEIMSLSDSEIAFNGLENTLTEIRATDAEYMSQWDWQQIRNHKRLHLIDIHQMILGSFDEPFPELPELTHLGIIKAQISHIVDFAFKDLPKLTIFNMKDNDIEVIERNIFSDPAEQLAIIDLSNNEIRSLPEDFFSNMPSLTDVHLDKNKFMTLNEKSFSAVLNKLMELTLNENPFRCDCRMRWLVMHRTPHRFIAECSSPESLKGRELRYLDLKSIQC